MLAVPLVIVIAVVLAGQWLLNGLRYGSGSALHRSLIDRDEPRALRLIRDGAPVNERMFGSLYPFRDGATPLHLAAQAGAVNAISALIAAGADQDALDTLGFSPLHTALRQGADQAAQALIRSGSKVHGDAQEGRAKYAIDNCGQPLQTALSYASIATVQAIIAAGATPAAELGEDAMAYVDGPHLLPKLQLLTKLGFSVEGAATRGRALHQAARRNDADAIRFLLDHGAQIEAAGGHYSFTPLLEAAYSGSTDAVRVLVERGANPRAGTDDFGSPLYAAAFSGKRETVRLLLSLNVGIDLQAGRASDQATPLHCAYWNQDTVMAQLLIEAGADANAMTNDGRLPREFVK